MDAAIDNRAAPLAPGTEAPGFELPSTPDQTVSLAEFRGQPVILAFYPEDWSPVCSDQLALYQELLPEFGRFDAELVGISVGGGSDGARTCDLRHVESTFGPRAGHGVLC